MNLTYVLSIFFLLVLFFSFLGILLVFILYPLWLLILSYIRAKKHSWYLANPSIPSVSIIVAVYNAEKIIEKKIKNFLSLNYPKEKLEVIFSSDGCTDATEKIIKKYANNRIKLISYNINQGKAHALNRGVKHASGDVIFFSDADAILEENVVYEIIKHYRDPEIGGVCGQRVVQKEDLPLKSSQTSYIKFDSMIKKLETKIGSITSNDGKLYSIRKELFQPIDDSVTDDLYTCLGVIIQGYRFIFEPNARAYISLPSRSPSHEIQRRRRIVARSLRGLYLRREIFNPKKYGLYSIGLFINKGLRRMMPVFLILIFFSSAFLSRYYSLIKILFLAQICGYLLAVLYIPCKKILSTQNPLRKLTSLAFYFCIGNIGTLLGLLAFIRGEKFSKWKPIKTDF
ncbi:MAG: glycosyltransferase family 2 protein [Desulfonauticus sp.]|nr:glycosyltransferase family 2 protein [Desulfonauticus sp.]